MPRSAANCAAELELGKNSKTAKATNSANRYELIRQCYEWQMKNLKAGRRIRQKNQGISGKIHRTTE
jgi:hypothetical protein